MKRLLCFIISVLMLVSLCACSDDTQTASKGMMSDNEKDKQAISIDYPAPSRMTYEDSTNKLGARYVFTLKEYNDMLNKACRELGKSSDTDFFDFNNWTVMSDNLTDDNGIVYETYCYPTDVLTITATIEKESKKVMQLSCGALYKQFEEGSEEFQYNVILTAAILAMVAGGYEQQDLTFLYSIFYDCAKEKKGFYYHSNMYMIDYTKGENDSESVVLFMTSPIKDEIKTEWKLSDYATFDGSFEPEK